MGHEMPLVLPEGGPRASSPRGSYWGKFSSPWGLREGWGSSPASATCSGGIQDHEPPLLLEATPLQQPYLPAEAVHGGVLLLAEGQLAKTD